MSELTFEQMLEEIIVRRIRNGEVVDGTVIDVKPDEIVLNIRLQSQTVSLQEMNIQTNANADLNNELVSVGDTDELQKSSEGK